MDNNRQSEIKQLVWDESFRQWVLHPTPALHAFWNQYLLENPHKASIVPQAREIVLSLQVLNRTVSEEEIQQRVRNTLQAIRTKEQLLTPNKMQLPPWYRKPWIRVAASVLLIISISWGSWNIYKSFTPETRLVTYQNLVRSTKESLIEKVNYAEQPLTVQLKDGSRVTLQKNSRISYNPALKGSKREVYLTGEAFFEVVKDPARPFIVYANELVTKVLGTSFTVKAYESDHQISVEVKTGKVSVFAEADPASRKKAAHRELEGVVLTPNQKIVFSRQEVRMHKSLVEKPVITTPAEESIRFEFDDTPVSEVFAALERAYSVDIVYDEELMHHCPLTASLNNEPLFEKLNIICKAVEARYQIIDGQIVIDSKGCND